MNNLLVAKRGKDTLYYDKTIDTVFGKKRFGHIVLGNGKKISVDMDDVLMRSNWDLIEPDWQNTANK